MKQDAVKQLNPLKRIGIALPLGTDSDVGIHTLNLALQAKSKRSDPVLLNVVQEQDISPLQRQLLRPLLDRYQQNRAVISKNQGRQLSFPVLHYLGERLSFSHSLDSTPGSTDIGLAFFTDSDIPLENIKRAFELPAVVASSSWHAQVLRGHGLKNVLNAPMGVDVSLFHSAPRTGALANRFTIYCGRSLSYRNGSDVVVAAFKAFQQRHPEALLVCGWGRAKPTLDSIEELSYSSHLDHLPNLVQGKLQTLSWLVENGIPASAVMSLDDFAYQDMPSAIRECDLALFPARATLGVPLEAMEAMACGIPTIVAANTGLLDLVDDHAYVLKDQGQVSTAHLNSDTTGWGETSIEELLSLMEKAYSQRSDALLKGEQSAQFIKAWQHDQRAEGLLIGIRRALNGEPLASLVSEEYRLGLCYHRAKRYEQAKNIYDRVLAMEPAHIGARMDRGHSLRELGNSEQAKVDFQYVVEHNPSHPQALQCLGNLLRREGNPDAGVKYLQRAVKASNTPALNWDLAWTLLLMGRYKEAWPHFNHRHAALGLRTPPPSKPRWDGKRVEKGALLVLDEQGLGDTLQFLRFLQLIPKGPNGRVIFAGKPATLSAVRQILPPEDVFEWSESLPHSYAWVPLMSLPMLLGVMTPESLPAPIRGALVDAKRLQKWRDIVHGNRAKQDKRPVVGLCWRGNPAFQADASRSPGLEVLQAILSVSGIRFVSLQVGIGRKEITELGLENVLEDVGGLIEDEGSDVLDTLAVIESCDLVISSCTSMVHMTGLTGCPGWVLLSTRPDWRWMLERRDSPWYPALTLMRQSSQGDWTELASRVAHELTEWRQQRSLESSL